MNITVFRVGYVGFVTGAWLADARHDVVCVDVDALKIDALKQGQISIFEPGLAFLVATNLAATRLSFTTDAAYGVAHGILQFIAVGTRPGENGLADLWYVLAAASAIASHMTDHRMIGNKSTVPVGTGDQVTEVVRQALADRGMDVSFDVCSNPKFLKEGTAIEDFTRGPRIVIGSELPRVQALMAECYAPPITATTIRF